eukprot:7088931-Alexandrium_andersonii.AAC.1
MARAASGRQAESARQDSTERLKSGAMRRDSDRCTTSQGPADGVREAREDRGVEARLRASSMFNAPPLPAREAG